jgi:hypothetical protein
MKGSANQEDAPHTAMPSNSPETHARRSLDLNSR